MPTRYEDHIRGPFGVSYLIELRLLISDTQDYLRGKFSDHNISASFIESGPSLTLSLDGGRALPGGLKPSYAGEELNALLSEVFEGKIIHHELVSVNQEEIEARLWLDPKFFVNHVLTDLGNRFANTFRKSLLEDNI